MGSSVGAAVVGTAVGGGGGAAVGVMVYGVWCIISSTGSEGGREASLGDRHRERGIGYMASCTGCRV